MNECQITERKQIGRLSQRRCFGVSSRLKQLRDLLPTNRRLQPGELPLRISVSNRWRSSSLFTKISFAAIIACVANGCDKGELPNTFELVEAGDQAAPQPSC
jgi:hypothetical protein